MSMCAPASSVASLVWCGVVLRVDTDVAAFVLEAGEVRSRSCGGVTSAVPARSRGAACVTKGNVFG